MNLLKRFVAVENVLMALLMGLMIAAYFLKFA